MKTKTSVLLIGGNNTQEYNFRVSNRFDKPSILYNGKYFFPYYDDIKGYRADEEGVKIGIQVVYNSGTKLYQDTYYLKHEKLTAILKFAKEKQLI